MNTPVAGSPTPPEMSSTGYSLDALKGREFDRRPTVTQYPPAEALSDAFYAQDTLRAVATSVPVELATPQTVGEYQVLRVAGRGGMGVVYEAVQADPLRAVAVKVLRPDLRVHPAAAERFRTEIRAAGRLHHSNIVPVLATATAAGNPIAYSMPFIRGDSLAAVLRGLRGGAEPPTEVAARVAALRKRDQRGYVSAAVEWVRQAAEAVAAAHAAGVVHRDVKPGNLLLEFDRTGRPHVWLIDFGLAVTDGDTGSGAFALTSGTPGYRSPEQAAAGPDGVRPPTDVYALGVTLSELLTLARPKDGVPVVCEPGVPRELRRVIVAATAGVPGDRYPSAAALADDLGRFLAGYPVQAGRRGWGRGLAKWAGRHCRPLAAAGATFAVAATVTLVLLADAYAAERAARVRADQARRAVAANAMSMDDILYATPGKLDTEREMLEQAVRVQQLQLAVEPNDRFARRHLAHASWRLSRVYTRSGRSADAVTAAERADRLYRQLAAEEPDQPLHLLDAARAQAILATAHWTSAPKNAVAALAADGAALDTVREAAQRFPEDLRVHDAVATYTHQYATALVSDGRGDEAEAFYRKACEQAEACRRTKPDQWRLACPAAAARMGLSQLFADRGRMTEALAENAEALPLCNGLLERATAEPAPDRLEVLSFRMTCARALAQRGEWLVASGGEADKVSADLDAAARTMATEHPDWRSTEMERAAHVRAWVAFRHARKGDAATAAREYEQLLQKREGTAFLAAQLSRLYADGPGERDAAKAEAEARKALQLSPNDPAARFALAAAEYRLGRLSDAAETVAPLADRPPHRTTYLLRAALAAHAGNAEEARRLVTEASAASVPVELCNPEWEAEVRQVLAAKADAPRR